MPALEKVLWAVHYDDLGTFLDRAADIGATGVAIRTDNDFGRAIPAFHARGIRVYGWRWPSSQRDGAMHEADQAVALFGKGLDGYFVDPEGAPGKTYDWDKPGLASLAEDFCARVAGAAGGKPFGITSHYRAAAVFPNLPWATFFRHSSILLPQAYWRSTEGVIGHGIPADNYDMAIRFWREAGGDPDKIVPMGGELAVAHPNDIAAHAAEAERQAISSLHFYCYDDTVPPQVWNAVAVV